MLLPCSSASSRRVPAGSYHRGALALTAARAACRKLRRDSVHYHVDTSFVSKQGRARFRFSIFIFMIWDSFRRRCRPSSFISRQLCMILRRTNTLTRSTVPRLAVPINRITCSSPFALESTDSISITVELSSAGNPRGKRPLSTQILSLHQDLHLLHQQGSAGAAPSATDQSSETECVTAADP